MLGIRLTGLALIVTTLCSCNHKIMFSDEDYLNHCRENSNVVQDDSPTHYTQMAKCLINEWRYDLARIYLKKAKDLEPDEKTMANLNFLMALSYHDEAYKTFEMQRLERGNSTTIDDSFMLTEKAKEYFNKIPLEFYGDSEYALHTGIMTLNNLTLPCSKPDNIDLPND